jgi:exonuclease III
VSILLLKLRLRNPNQKIKFDNKNKSFLQWNANGLNSNKVNQLKILLDKYKPIVVAIQETKFHEDKIFQLKGYNIFARNHPNDSKLPHGGIITMIKEEYHAEPIPLKTVFQANAIKIDFPVKMTFCNIYLHHDDEVNDNNLENLVSQLGENFLLLGDFNAHNTLWGSKVSNSRGKTIERLIDNHNLIVLNEEIPTHLSFSKKTFSNIDLSIASVEIAEIFDWQVADELYLSDHFPIVIEFHKNQNEVKSKERWRMKEANWELFRKHLKSTVEDT